MQVNQPRSWFELRWVTTIGTKNTSVLSGLVITLFAELIIVRRDLYRRWLLRFHALGIKQIITMIFSSVIYREALRISNIM